MSKTRFWLFMATVMVVMTTTGCGPAPDRWKKTTTSDVRAQRIAEILSASEPSEPSAQIRVIGAGDQDGEHVIRFPAPKTAPVAIDWSAGAGAIRHH